MKSKFSAIEFELSFPFNGVRQTVHVCRILVLKKNGALHKRRFLLLKLSI